MLVATFDIINKPEIKFQPALNSTFKIQHSYPISSNGCLIVLKGFKNIVDFPSTSPCSEVSGIRSENSPSSLTLSNDITSHLPPTSSVSIHPRDFVNEAGKRHLGFAPKEKKTPSRDIEKERERCYPSRLHRATKPKQVRLSLPSFHFFPFVPPTILFPSSQPFYHCIPRAPRSSMRASRGLRALAPLPCEKFKFYVFPCTPAPPPPPIPRIF